MNINIYNNYGVAIIIIIRVYFNGHPGHGFIHHSGLTFFYSGLDVRVLISSLTIAFIVIHY